MAGAGPVYEDDEGGGGVISEINVTPLVDIVLVLLIIMMVAAPLIVQNAPSIKVELPKAQTGEETQKSTVALTLRKDGTLYYNEDAVDEAKVRERITAEFAKNAQVQAIVAADKGVPYGSVMHLIDLVKSLGVTKFALNIDASP